MRKVISGEHSIEIATMLAAALISVTSRAEAQSLEYINIPFDTAEMNFTGIRGANIVGNYVIPGTGGESGGMLYRLDTRTWIPVPTSTANGVNFPGATTALPYGPTFGSPDGVMRLVGSYKTDDSSANIGYIYDAAAAPGSQYTDIVYPSSSGLTISNTIPHSMFGNYAVGNYNSTQRVAGAFIYNISDKTYTNLAAPGAFVTSAYGIYGDKVAGGYTDQLGLDAQHGMFYDMSTGTFTTYDHPGSIATHFEGITGGGRHGEYNLGADWIDPQGNSHASILHINSDGTYFWRELDVPGSLLTSIDSIYAGNAVGFYFDANKTMMNYFVTVPGVYDPIRNAGALTVDGAGAVGLAGISGDDIVNDGSITVSGTNAVGISSDTYGVVTNNGSIAATGSGSSAVRLDGLDGALINTGTITAAEGAFAVTTGANASGTTVVNTGTIDGLVNFVPGADGRFENDGWLGVSGTGAGAAHQMSGVFSQTSTGTLAMRFDGATSDTLQIAGAARLDGTLAASFSDPAALQRTYTFLTATEGVTGTFATFSTEGLPAFIDAMPSYSSNAVALSLTSDLANIARTPNQQAVATALDAVINSGSSDSLYALPSALSAFYDLPAAALPAALASLSGEGYASEQTVLIGDSIYSRDAVMGRLRQADYGQASGALGTLAFSGPATASAATTGATQPSGVTLWAEGLGSWANYDGSNGKASVNEGVGGLISGADSTVGSWRVGGALGYIRSNATMDDVSSSFDANSYLIALYAGGQAGPLNLRLGASYAYNQIDASRSVGFTGYASQSGSSYDGGTTQLFGEVSHGFAAGSVALEPFAGLAWVHLNTGGTTEDNAGAAGLNVGSTSSDVGYSSLGLRIATKTALPNGMGFSPHLSAAWQYGFGDLTPAAQMSFVDIGNASFGVNGVPLAANTALIDAGFDLAVAPQARVGLSYVGQFASESSANGFKANFDVRF